MKLFALTLFCGCFLVALAEKLRFDNYRVYSVNVENDIQLKVLQELEDFPCGITFLDSPNLNKTVDIVVSPYKLADVSELFKTFKLKHRTRTNNLQKLIDNEQPKLNSSCQCFDWKRYYDLDEIYAWLDRLLAEYSDVLTPYNYGKSYENRTLRAVKVSFKAGNPTIFIESTNNGREWITAATATYLLNELLTSDDEKFLALANNYDWVIVPVANVDGYQYTHTTNRLWRKTRKPYEKMCVGADPNRNFDIHHSSVENVTSETPCSEIYPGPNPFSEPEVLALSEFIKTFHNIKLYISFHSFRQMLLFPYGYTYDKAHNNVDLERIAHVTTSAMARRYGTTYKAGSIAESLYPANGSSIDWVHDKQNVSLAYSFQLRDTGRYGFNLPSHQIIPTSREIIDGLQAMIKESEIVHSSIASLRYFSPALRWHLRVLSVKFKKNRKIHKY